MGCFHVNFKKMIMKKFLYILSGFVAGIVFVMLLGASVVSSQMFLVDESKYGFNETIDKIEEIGKESGWNISHIYNLQATMAKHSLSVNPVVVMSLCKPQIAYHILGSDNELPASAVMPCRVSVYQASDGKIMISRMNATLLSSMLSGISKEAMAEASRENEEILKHLVKK